MRKDNAKHKRLTIVEKEKIAEMTASGWSADAIAREIGCSKVTVYAQYKKPFVREKINEHLNKLGIYSPIVTAQEVMFFRETALTQLLALTKDPGIDARDRITAAKTLLEYHGLSGKKSAERGGFQPLPDNPGDNSSSNDLNFDEVQKSIMELKFQKKMRGEYGADDEYQNLSETDRKNEQQKELKYLREKEKEEKEDDFES